MPTVPPLTHTIQKTFPARIIAAHQYRGQETVLIKREALLEVAGFLRDDPAMGFDLLMDLTAVDHLKFGTSSHSAPTLATPSPLPYYMDSKPSEERWERLVSNDDYRFDVVYHFYSTTHNHRLRLKVPLTLADPVVDSLSRPWAGANWFEREVWDMFGIRFTDHPNLRRLLLYDEFRGHPLRYDYAVRRSLPLIGPVN